jgi:hypothetical protein
MCQADTLSFRELKIFLELKRQILLLVKTKEDSYYEERETAANHIVSDADYGGWCV